MNREEFDEYGEDLLFLDPDYFDKCIVGIVDSACGSPKVCYSTDAVIETLMAHEGMDYEEAQEHFSFNVSGSYVGPNTPCFLSIHPEVMEGLIKSHLLKQAIEL